jgi:1,2-diacylglycerol 3-beta-glucosyltransferase
VPARDEAAVIGDLIADLGAQNLRHASGVPAFEVTVIVDRATDETGTVAMRAIEVAGLSTVARCMTRTSGHDGKGAALAVVPLDDLAIDTIVLVLDADARLAGGTLVALVEAFDDASPGLTARRRMMAPIDGRRAWLARWQDDEQCVDGAIQRARLSSGGTGELRGNGMAVRAGDLRDIGGWDPHALCEDLEATVRLAGVAGVGIRWSPEVEVWEQPVLDAAGLLRQRLRWSEGAVRRDLRVTWPLVLRPGIRSRLRADLAAYAAQTLVPWLAIGLLARSNRPAARRRLLVLAGTYVSATVTIAARTLPSPTTRVPGAMAMGALWPLVLPLAWVRIALSRGPIAYAKTEHRPGFRPPMPTRDASEARPRPPRASDRH